MDMKQLIAQIDHIESKQILNEGFPTVADAQARADKEKTTGKFDKKELSTGTQYTRKSSTFDDGGKDSDTKKAEKKAKVKEGVDQTSIYEMLIREFGYDLDERVTINPDGTTSGGIAPAPASKISNPYQGADAAKFAAMSPADQAWLTRGGGVPDINDEFILARAPNKGAAVAKPAAPAAGGAAQPAPAMTAADQDDADMGAAMRANAAGGNSTSAATGIGNPGEEAAAQAAATTAADQDDAAMGAAMTANAAAAGPTAGGDTGEVPGVTTQAGATPTAPAGGAAQPARPAANKSMTPAITAYASRMGLLKNNKPDVAAIKKFQQDNGLKADGIIGPNTAGAILSAQKPGAGGRGGATAAQAASATKPASGAAQPAPTGKPPRYKTAQEFDKEIARFSKTSNPNLPPNARYIATLQAEKAALGSGGAAQPASATKPAAAPGASGGMMGDIDPNTGMPKNPMPESVKSQDDAILERIRTALFR